MMNSSERHVYVGELNLYTFRNLFPNHAPKAQPLFDQLKVHFDAKQLSTYVYSTKSLSLRSFDLTEPGFAKLLFWLVDPSILDPDYADQTKGTKRTAKRGANEEPVLSAHVVVDLSKAHDTKRSYPMAIESVDNLPRSLIILYLNKCFDSHFAVNKKRTSKKDTKVFKPHCKFVAPYSHTLEGVLAKGGALKGVKLVQEGVVSQSFGDKTYPVLENRDVQMKVQNMPRGQAAKTMLEDIWNGQKITYLKKMKVTIEDEFDNIKTLDIDLRKNDILSNFFSKKGTNYGIYKTPQPLRRCIAQRCNSENEESSKTLNPFLERSVFLRSLNFLRVKHQFVWRYNFSYPLLITVATTGLLWLLAPAINIYGASGLINDLTPFLAVFAPFFLASLAAVSTFSGPDFFDKPFEMEGDVTLTVVGEMGALEPMDVTPRHFLSLLFGYCCVVSLSLFMFTIMAPIIAVRVAEICGEYAELLGWFGLAVFLFLFFQVILSTLLGIYYLSDKIHR